jgi:hypothetical protein
MRVNCNCRKVSQEGDDLNWVSAPLGRSRVKRASGALEAIETKKTRQNLDRRRTHLWVLMPRLWSQTVCVVYQYSNCRASAALASASVPLCVSMCVSMTRNQRVARMRQINISLDSDSTRNTHAAGFGPQIPDRCLSLGPRTPDVTVAVFPDLRSVVLNGL